LKELAHLFLIRETHTVGDHFNTLRGGLQYIRTSISA